MISFFFFFFNDFGSKLSTNHIIIILVAHNEKPMDIIILQKINHLIYKFLSPPKVTFSKLILYIYIYIYIYNFWINNSSFSDKFSSP